MTITSCGADGTFGFFSPSEGNESIAEIKRRKSAEMQDSRACRWNYASSDSSPRSVGDGGEPVKGKELAKDARGLVGEIGTGRGGGRQLAAHDPTVDFLPFRGRFGPAVVLSPLALFHGIPVAFVAAAEALFLLRDPT